MDKRERIIVVVRSSFQITIVQMPTPAHTSQWNVSLKPRAWFHEVQIGLSAHLIGTKPPPPVRLDSAKPPCPPPPPTWLQTALCEHHLVYAPWATCAV